MLAGCSFAKYVKNICYNSLYSTVEKYVKVNCNQLGLHLYHVNIWRIDVVDAIIQRVCVRYLPSTMVSFEVGVEIDLIAKEQSSRHDEYDDCFPCINM